MLLFFACAGSSPPDPVDTSSYVALWNDEPNRFVREVKLLPLEERMIIVRAVLEDPAAHHSPQLCQFFDSKEKDYCEQLLLRSHIWEYDQIRQNLDSINHPVRLLPEQKVVAEPIQLSPSKSCRQDNAWCIEEEAKQNIRAEKFLAAKSLCQSIQHSQSKEECFFQIAEEVTKKLSPSKTPEAMVLCVYSETYQENCFAHLIEVMSDSYSELFPQYKNEIAQFWRPKDAQFAKQLDDYLETSFSKHNPSSKEISFVHRNSAMTYSFLLTQPKQDRTLQEWKEIFQNQQEFSAISEQPEIKNYWSPLRDKETLHCRYLSLAHRPCTTKETEDWELAMVAALVQQDFPLDKIRGAQSDTIQKLLNKVRKHQ